MRQLLPRPVPSLAAVAAAAVLLTTAAAAPGAAAVRPAMQPPATPAASAGPAAANGPAHTIVLLNGDRLVTAAGARVPGIVPGARGRLAAAMLALDVGGKAYDIPRAALPYLGHGLDPDLFLVSSLARQETAARLPVTVTYRGRAPSLPGVTISDAGHGSARGYLTASGAAAFGAALARQFIADHARDSYGQDGLFAGGLSIRLAGMPATARPATGFPMHTLTVTGTNLAGKPDTGDQVMIFNASNPTLFSDPIESDNSFYHGATKFSVPSGHYWAIGLFPTLLKREIEWHVPILPQFTVSANTTVHMAERAADKQIGVTTPKPAYPVNLQWELRRTSPAGPAVAQWWFGGYSPMYISPVTRKTTAGTLQTYLFEQLFSPPKAPGIPYEYDVAYADTKGVIPSQHYVVRASGLATVHARYYSDVSTTGYETRFGVFGVQWRTDPGVLFAPRRVPRQQTEYLTGNPAVRWADTYEQYFRNLAGGQLDDLRIFHAGEQLGENWNAYPLHAGYNTNLVGAANLSPPPAPSIPSASRKGNTLTLDVMPFSDSTPGHVSANGFFGGQVGTLRQDHRPLPDRRERKDARVGQPVAGRPGGRPVRRVPHPGHAEPAPRHGQVRARRVPDGQGLHDLHRQPDRVDLAVTARERSPAARRVGLRAVPLRRPGRRPVVRGAADDDAGVRGAGRVAARGHPPRAAGHRPVRGPPPAGARRPGDPGGHIGVFRRGQDLASGQGHRPRRQLHRDVPRARGHQGVPAHQRRRRGGRLGHRNAPERLPGLAVTGPVIGRAAARPAPHRQEHIPNPETGSTT